MREILARRVYRTGVQTVEREETLKQSGDASALVTRYFLTIRNRSYESEVEVDRDTAVRYYQALRQ